jgi:anti-anti-sigma regulatory factor
MIQLIQVARVLREAVTTPYRIMVTRATGAAVRGRIESVLTESSCQAAVLDFSGVEMLDLSCADEVVAKLLRSGRTRYVALAGLRDELRESVHEVLEPQHLCVACVTDADDLTPALLGSVTDDARAAFAQLGHEVPTTAAAVAATLGWAPERAAQALDALVTLRLARPVDAGFTLLPLA